MSGNLTLEEYKKEKLRIAQGAYDEGFYSWSAWNYNYRQYLAGADRDIKPKTIVGAADPPPEAITETEQEAKARFQTIRRSMPYNAGKTVNYTEEQLAAVLVTDFGFYPLRRSGDWHSLYDTYLHNGLQVKPIDVQQAIAKSTKEAEEFVIDQKRKEAARVEELKRIDWDKSLKKNYYKYFEYWTTTELDAYIAQWKMRNSKYSRKELYDILLHNNFGLALSFGILVSATTGQGRQKPWIDINAFIGDAPPNPDNLKNNAYNINLYYDHTLPHAAVIAEWYNTPGVDLGDIYQRTALAYKFGWSPRAEISANAKIIKDGATPPDEALPIFYVVAAVAGIGGIAYITSKVTK